MTTEELATTALEKESHDLVTRVQALVVTDDYSYHEALTYERLGKDGETKAEEQERPNIQRWHDGHKQALAKLAALKLPFTQVKKLAGDKRLVWEQEQARLRQIAEAQARAEQERLEAEAQALADAETARLTKQAEDQRIVEAAEAEAAGDRMTAERIISAPVMVAPVIPTPVFRPPVSVPVAPNAGSRANYTARCVDLVALVKAAAGGNTVALGLLACDQRAADGLARALKVKDGGMLCPGVVSSSKAIAVTR